VNVGQDGVAPLWSAATAANVQRAASWFDRWWPALAWAAVMFSFSTGAFSTANTGRVILPILRWMFPSASAAALAEMHFLIRKCGHFTEYFVLSLLLLRGLRAGQRETRLGWALLAIAIVAGYAALDELHQSFVPGRGGLEISDIVLDTISGAAAQGIAALAAQRRRARGKRREDSEREDARGST
jgi:VanZ family protein